MNCCKRNSRANEHAYCSSCLLQACKGLLCSAGAVPAKGRPDISWGGKAGMIADRLLAKALSGSILQLHLFGQHLLIVCASPADSSTAATAVWLDCTTLECTTKVALPAGACQAWTDYGLQKTIISTSQGDVLTLPLEPQVD